MSSKPSTVTTSNTWTSNNTNQTMSVNSGGPFGAAGALTLHDSNNEHEQLSVADIRMFKEMCEFLHYLAMVDPKFEEYMTAFKAKKRILR
jgi:hypothetical protein